MIERRPFERPAAATTFRVLAIDGGGIRGLIAARVLRHLEAQLRARSAGATLAQRFDLVAGTSTGGLIALGLTAPGASGGQAMTAAELVELYEGDDGRAIFRRSPLRRVPVLRTLLDLVLPRYSLAPLAAVLERRFGEQTVADATTEVLVTAYDLTERRPRFFKRWHPDAAKIRIVDAGIATAAAPSYFPPRELAGRALIDGGVFASNPTVAAIVEALKRTEDTRAANPDDLLVVSLGTGHHEISFTPDETRRWGAADWILPRRSGDPPLIGAMLDGQSDAADHWAHVLLNREPDGAPDGALPVGAGPRYFRFQVELPGPLPLDDASPANVSALAACAERLIEARIDELDALADALARPVPEPRRA